MKEAKEKLLMAFSVPSSENDDAEEERKKQFFNSTLDLVKYTRDYYKKNPESVNLQ